MPILISNNLDPYHNLAVESCLLDGLGPSLPVLFLWQSARAVVIGKNQNPWQECSLAYMTRQQIPLCRRESGGGAVYHDEGNLNFCMVLDRNTYREENQFKIIIQALSKLGITAHREGQSSLFAGDRKISGNAYCFRRDRAMHHGTLLIDTDLEPLRECLRPRGMEIRTHAIASVPAPVANMKDLHPEITLSAVQETVLSSWQEAYPGHGPRVEIDDLGHAELETRRKHLASDAWCYRHTPKFSHRLNLSSGRSLELEIRKGLISSASVSDLPASDQDWLGEQLLDRPFGQRVAGDAAPSRECTAVLEELDASFQ